MLDVAQERRLVLLGNLGEKEVEGHAAYDE
jgi:hypothetical protein